MALVLPLDWMTTSPRVVGIPADVRRGVTAAATVLAVTFAIKIGCELLYKEPSYYDMLEVLPSADSAEVKKGYKRASLRVHPDKLQAAGEDAAEVGEEAFMAVKAAYDVLSDHQLRDLYNKFGTPGLENKDDTTNLLAGIGFFYVVWLALAYLLTQRKTVGRAQIWSFSGLLALGIFEYQACILSFDFLQDQLPQLAMFEKIELLHRLYPLYLLGSRLVARLFFQDVDAHNFVVLQHLHWKTDQLRLRLHVLTGHTTAPGAVPFASPKEWMDVAKESEELLVKQQQQNGGAPAAHLAATTSLPAFASSAGPPGGAAQHPAVPSAARPAAAKGGGGGGRNLSGLIWFFGVYFFFQWLVGRGS